MQLFSARSRVQSLLLTTITVVSKLPQRTTSSTAAVVAAAFQPLNSLTKAAKAPHQPSFFSSSNLPTHISFRGGSSLFSSASSGVNGESQNNKEKEKKNKNIEGQTGWNHNLPKETSSFWTSSSPSSSSSSSSKEGYTIEKEEPKTGWLHNTKSKNPKSSTTPATTADKNKPGKESKAQKLLRMAKLKQKVNHRMVSPPVFHPCGEGRRAVVTEHFISVPLKYGQGPTEGEGESEESIDVYFSIVDLVSSTEDESFFNSLQTRIATQDLSSQTKMSRLREQQKRANQYIEFINMKDADQCILYLQGGKYRVLCLKVVPNFPNGI